MTITELCEELRNWFEVKRYYGEFRIVDGAVLDLSDYLLYGQYYRIKSSVFNDGVHQFRDYNDALRDETFKGEIWALAIPKTVLELCDKISKWEDKYGDKVNSPFTSEDVVGLYSYSKDSAGSGENGLLSGWRSAFISDLIRWRKI